jgi:hypothetical protein
MVTGLLWHLTYVNPTLVKSSDLASSLNVQKVIDEFRDLVHTSLRLVKQFWEKRRVRAILHFDNQIY